MLAKVAKVLDEASDPNKMVLCPSGEDEMGGADDVLSEYESSDGSFTGWSPQSPQSRPSLLSGSTPTQSRFSVSSKALSRRIRQDLRLAKAAGFRVGHLGALFTSYQESFVMISCRIAKLGISEEALQAWQLASNQYFILLIHYSNGYRTLERITGDEASGPKTVRMRLGVSHKYRIGLSDAVRAFGGTKDRAETKDELIIERPDPTAGLNSFFISRPLDELLNERLARLLGYRLDGALSWASAEKFYNDHQGRKVSVPDDIVLDHDDAKASRSKNLPNLVTADHLTQKTAPFSFPLLAMQFALRHLVRCTEFCLVCHCKVEETFEALKPYVCSKPLCLYQYVKLGFGPSIEHEIISQPYVVDLLISFCYASAAAGKMNSFPVGMGLLVPSLSLLPAIRPLGIAPATHSALLTLPMVPRMSAVSYSGNTLPENLKPVPLVKEPVIHKAKLDRINKELHFPRQGQPLSVGQWIFIRLPGPAEDGWHCRVIETVYEIVRLGNPVIRSKYARDEDTRPSCPMASVKTQPHPHGVSSQSQQQPRAAPYLGTGSIDSGALPSPPAADAASLLEVELIVYEQNFDDLGDAQKQSALCVLLDTLPSVGEMKTFLQCNSGNVESLQAWAERVSPAALGVLRWIIASNRSCIIQVDNLDGDPRRAEERVSGMPKWMQFRFAQGAPDKEQRFLTSVRDTSMHLQHPTLFAWHGSPLPNWHGILREGLHFRVAEHGRAFGHGVYHALHVYTSLTYSSGSRFLESERPPVREWLQSALRISEALSLNEIVNAPDQFVSKYPHLVVDQLDWIQSRYLFVMCNMPGLRVQDTTPTQVYEQDPAWTPTGQPSGHQIQIPIAAINKSRRPASYITRLGSKRVKTGSGHAESESDDGIVLSDESDVEDLKMLSSDDEDVPPATTSPTTTTQGKTGKNVLNPPCEPARTDFAPGTLNHAELPLLEAPSYATPMATKALQRELNHTLQVQETHPAHELGWYIDPNLVSNVYQWIVELHSFESHLPLAMDMKQKDLKSVILELRFGKDYPISPPFVRVIRPRFLRFMAGGGGHVTYGGALCMELLTNSGWSAVSNIESVLLQVRLAISSTDPRPARIEPGPVQEYGVGEAVEAYVRACNAHGVSNIEIFF